MHLRFSYSGLLSHYVINPFDFAIEDLPIDLQMEIIDLRSNDILKDKFKEGNLIEFYKCLPSEQYSYLKKFAREFISAFGTTYLCEKTFSRMKCINLATDHNCLINT